ncbi:FecCD family ABC transporter permease [Fusobacterium polymorphum]|uniref:Iron ABC transporter n=1 Tax=Fusobacterium nucleatum subsp. polymorphum TaxID=76857 RepID=A0A241PZQ5_FUSNP|nr:iron ABC transporter permease [Fusobacterium polymorphum]ASG28053.1 iron ABC transporter [Fusobacterium polymorphum]
MKKKFFLMSLMITFIVITLSLSVGSVFIPIKSLLFLSPMDEYTKTILFDLRLPRILMAFLVGMLLASSGNVVQIIFQNPLADPYIIGIASSATFGAVIAYLLKLPEFFYGIVAFICCMVSTLLIFKISKRGNKIEVNTLLIVGITLSSFLAGFTSFAIYMIGEDSFKITMWLMGYLGNASWNQIVFLIIPLIFSSVYFYAKRNELDILMLGDEQAHSLGIDIAKLKFHLLIVSSFVVAYSVAFTGMIGFVGLIVPHIMRNIIGPLNKRLIPFVLIYGGIFLLTCDTLGRIILAPVEIPIGVIASILGAPFFLYLALKRSRRK